MGPETGRNYDPTLDPWKDEREDGPGEAEPDDEKDLFMSDEAKKVRQDMRKFGMIGGMDDETAEKREGEAAGIITAMKEDAGKLNRDIILLAEKRDSLSRRPHTQEEMDALNAKIEQLKQEEESLHDEIRKLQGKR